MKTAYTDIASFVTKDGSLIRELIHPNSHNATTLSFAEAIVEPGITTHLHRHLRAEEIYHITSGTGQMRLGEREFAISAGDSIVIAPGTAHNVTNTGGDSLKILCACHPPYADEDTELL